MHPNYLVPRIHCLDYRKVHVDDLIARNFTEMGMKLGEEQKTRNILNKMILDLCFGDKTLAEYLLISLITSPILR